MRPKLNLLENPAWHALQTTHGHLRVAQGSACRYPADVSPFGAVEDPKESALREVADLLGEDESVWLIGDSLPTIPALTCAAKLLCLEMLMPHQIQAPALSNNIVPLTCEHAQEMVALTEVAFPGFFRKRTCAMGSYFGIRSESGQLIAMAGERLCPPGLPEVSGVCTRAEYRGRGYAASLIWRVISYQREQGLQPWLYVTCSNSNAIRLYSSMGFETIREVLFSQVHR